MGQENPNARNLLLRRTDGMGALQRRQPWLNWNDERQSIAPRRPRTRARARSTSLTLPIPHMIAHLLASTILDIRLAGLFLPPLLS